MRVYFRRPNGDLRCYEVKSDDPYESIAIVRQHDKEALNTTVFAVLNGQATAEQQNCRAG